MSESAAAAVAPSPSAETETKRSPWVVSAGFDSVWLLSGIWLWVAYSLIGTTSVGAPFFAAISASAAALALIHNWSTTYTVIFSPLFREARAKRPVEIYVIPALIVVGCMALGAHVATGPSFEEGQMFGWAHAGYAVFLLLFVLGHFWHFAQQDFGVLSLYRQRMGQFRPIDRKADLYYSRAMTLVIQPILFIAVMDYSPWTQFMVSWLPVSSATIQTLATVAVIASLILSAGILIFEVSKPNNSLPRFLYLAIIALHAIALYRSVDLLYYFVYLVTHWTVAISLSWRINRNHALQAEEPRRALLTYLATFGAFLVASLSITFGLKEFDVITDGNFRDYVGRSNLFAGLVIGYVLGEQMVHYYCDAALFRFKDPFVRQNVGPLLR